MIKTQTTPAPEHLHVHASHDPSPIVVYVVEMTEYERGWGSRPDGFLAFKTESDAQSYVREETKDRTGHAPDYYISYDLIGYLKCSHRFLTTLLHSDRNFVCFDRVSELLA